MSTEVIGFADPNIDDKLEINNKIKCGGKKSGGFGAMGLSFPVIKGIKKRGYNIPTPIQRKSIPLILEGRDVVAMARTGSGKTACFLIPLFEKLKGPTAKSGARALILSPTRELALQTLKFLKEIGRFTGLRPVVVLGGDSMDNQFEAIHGNPDIIVATPGRFLHLCVEMDLKLNSIGYIVFDEADRLFEMGFGEQLHEIVNRLPESRQTLLFSATLPKVLVEFAKAGLSDPVLLRLDVESKLPDHLKLAFVCCRSEEKPAALLCILKHVIKPNAQTVLFAATMHHVEYLRLILDMAGISNTFIYSNLDPSARKINSAKFQMRKASVLIVTDVAARGIDIPQLDNVINYNFPAKSKLFVHRVGRCARAGRSGTAFSLISGDEGPYLLDLHLFLGRPFNIKAPTASTVSGEFPDGAIGQIPRTLLEEEHGVILSWHETKNDMANMRQVSSNAYKQYMRSRPGASVESVKRVKEMDLTNLAIHPAFTSRGKLEKEKLQMLGKMKNYRPSGTVFEIGQSASSTVYTVMKIAREKHHGAILNYAKKLEERENENLSLPKMSLPMSNADDITSTFQSIVAPKKRKHLHVEDMSKGKKKRVTVDKDHYIPYTAPDHHTEQGLAVNNFQQEASKNSLDLNGDTGETLKLHKKTSRWDPKKKKMVSVNQDPKSRKIRTESGAWIPATYKTNRYAQWKERTKVAEEQDDEDEDENATQKMGFHKFPSTHWGQHNKKVHLKAKSELKRPEQILKNRIIQERKQKKNKGKKKSKKSKKARRK